MKQSLRVDLTFHFNSALEQNWNLKAFIQKMEIPNTEQKSQQSEMIIGSVAINFSNCKAGGQTVTFKLLLIIMHVLNTLLNMHPKENQGHQYQSRHLIL